MNLKTLPLFFLFFLSTFNNINTRDTRGTTNQIQRYLKQIVAHADKESIVLENLKKSTIFSMLPQQLQVFIDEIHNRFYDTKILLTSIEHKIQEPHISTDELLVITLQLVEMLEAVNAISIQIIEKIIPTSCKQT
jgi:hypothetical protein